MEEILVLQNPAKKSFYQWDLDQRFQVLDSQVATVQFYSSKEVGVLTCLVYEKNGIKFVDIPNILFQTSGRFKVYVCYKDSTIVTLTFDVISRPKPADYIYTETEVYDVQKYVQLYLNEELKNNPTIFYNLIDDYFASKEFIISAE